MFVLLVILTPSFNCASVLHRGCPHQVGPWSWNTRWNTRSSSKMPRRTDLLEPVAGWARRPNPCRVLPALPRWVRVLRTSLWPTLWRTWPTPSSTRTRRSLRPWTRTTAGLWSNSLKPPRAIGEFNGLLEKIEKGQEELRKRACGTAASTSAVASRSRTHVQLFLVMECEPIDRAAVPPCG